MCTAMAWMQHSSQSSQAASARSCRSSNVMATRVVPDLSHVVPDADGAQVQPSVRWGYSCCQSMLSRVRVLPLTLTSSKHPVKSLFVSLPGSCWPPDMRADLRRLHQTRAPPQAELFPHTAGPRAPPRPQPCCRAAQQGRPASGLLHTSQQQTPLWPQPPGTRLHPCGRLRQKPTASARVAQRPGAWPGSRLRPRRQPGLPGLLPVRPATDGSQPDQKSNLVLVQSLQKDLLTTGNSGCHEMGCQLPWTEVAASVVHNPLQPSTAWHAGRALTSPPGAETAGQWATQPGMLDGPSTPTWGCNSRVKGCSALPEWLCWHSWCRQAARAPGSFHPRTARVMAACSLTASSGLYSMPAASMHELQLPQVQVQAVLAGQAPAGRRLRSRPWQLWFLRKQTIVCLLSKT